MKILQVTPSFYPAKVYGGPIQSVYHLCSELAQIGCEVRVLTTDANGLDKVLSVDKSKEVVLSDGLRVRYCRRLWLHTVSTKFLLLLPGYIKWADVVHVTAVYSFATIPALLTCKLLGKPVIWSPRGALQRWEGTTHVRVKALWELICRIVAPSTLVLHVTSKEEAVESLKRFPNVETIIIPNGVNVPDQISHAPRDGTLRLLYLGRLHPIKGVENLLAACKILNDSFASEWSLTIAGSGNKQYVETIRSQMESLKLQDKVRMVGEVTERDKQSLFQNSDITVVPSHKENFGIVVAESLAHGVPVIAAKNTPWSRLEELQCGLWADNDPASLASAIAQMSRRSLAEMGCQGRKWMQREFSWDSHARKMLACYTALQNGGSIGEMAYLAE